jgi:hypothetical protein
MNALTQELVAYNEYKFRLIDHGGNRWIVAVDFKVLAVDFPTAIQSASKFIREHRLVPNNFTIGWCFDRASLNTFVYTGGPK